MGCDILQRGFPLLSEKPPALTVAELHRLMDAARSSGAIHQVAFNRRFMPLVGELKQQLAGQTILHLEIQQARVQRTEANFATTAIHAIDMARFLAGSDYTQITVTYQELSNLGPGVANYLVDGTFASGATVHLAIHPVSGLNIERTTVYTLHHTYFLQNNNGPDAPGRLCHFYEGKLIAELDAYQWTGRREDYFLNGFFQEDAAFFDAVRTGQQPIHDFQSCLQSIAIMECLMERKTRLVFS